MTILKNHNKNRTQKGHILALLSVLKPGDFFYTEVDGKELMRYCAKYAAKVKIETEYSINPKLKTVTKLLKVTIL